MFTISKCVNILKFCCISKEGCVQYFYKCFNNAKTCNSRPLNDSRQIVLSRYLLSNFHKIIKLNNSKEIAKYDNLVHVIADLQI